MPESDENLIENLLKTEPNKFSNILEKQAQLEIQIIYTRLTAMKRIDLPSKLFITRLTQTALSIASTIKLPMCLLGVGENQSTSYSRPDFKNGVEFMLSAVINVNTDEIYNDGKYDYDNLGYPFMKNLG